VDIDELKKTIDEKTPFFQARLAEMIEIPSVKGPAKAHAPFGQGPRAALNQALMIAQSLGLTTKQLNDQVGWAELTGKDESYIAALGHLDVVASFTAMAGKLFCRTRSCKAIKYLR
jgi:succinyl-diaminopimelate desuccinylase